nr:unnamed protein product [Callosobruchus chinensis]
MLKMCEWSQESKPCSELFNNYLTDEGLCCSFNRLPPNITFRNPNEISVLNQTYTTDIYDWDPERDFQRLHRGTM